MMTLLAASMRRPERIAGLSGLRRSCAIAASHANGPCAPVKTLRGDGDRLVSIRKDRGGSRDDHLPERSRGALRAAALARDGILSRWRGPRA